MDGLDVLQRMIRALFIAFNLSMLPLFADLTSPRPVEEIRYGVASDRSFEVTVGGDVSKAGRYFVPNGFGLKSVLGIVAGYGWTEQRTHYSDGTGQFQGRVVVHRLDESGNTKSITFKLSELQLAKTPDFELRDGDVIEFPHIKIWEK